MTGIFKIAFVKERVHGGGRGSVTKQDSPLLAAGLVQVGRPLARDQALTPFYYWVVERWGFQMRRARDCQELQGSS